MDAEMVEFDMSLLRGRDRRVAKYFACLAQFRAVAARFAAALARDGEASLEVVDAAAARLLLAGETAAGDMLQPLPAAAVVTGYSHSHLRQLVRKHGPEGDHQIRAEKRFGGWWLLVEDVERLQVAGELRGPQRRE